MTRKSRDRLLAEREERKSVAELVQIVREYGDARRRQPRRPLTLEFFGTFTREAVASPNEPAPDDVVLDYGNGRVVLRLLAHAIGQRIHARGGVAAMQRVLNRVRSRARPGDPWHVLDKWWDGIGRVAGQPGWLS